MSKKLQVPSVSHNVMEMQVPNREHEVFSIYEITATGYKYKDHKEYVEGQMNMWMKK